MDDNNQQYGANSLQNNQKDTYILKFVVLGDSGVGKTSILHHFIFSKCII